MKALFVLLTGASLLLMSVNGFAAEKGDAQAQLKSLVEKIQAKLQGGKDKESDYPEELKEFDTLLKEHEGEKTEDVAQILVMKSMLYIQVFEEPEKGIEMLKALKKDFPETPQGQKVDSMLEAVQKQVEANKIKKALVVGAVFPDWQEKDLNGNPLTIAQFKGKVVLLDFWATWCGPCIAELPSVLETYEKYNKQGFEIIGISLDRDEEKLTSFIRERKMTWPQYYDGQGWQNKLAVKYGVQSIPATYLLDGEGKIVAMDLRGPALGKAVGELLEKK